MGIRINIDPKKSHIDTLIKELAHIKHGAPKAMSMALNATAAGIRKDITEAVTKVYFVTPGAVGKTMKTRRANPARLTAAVISTGSVIPLYKYNVKVSGRTVHVQVRRDSAGGDLKGAFIAKMKSKHIGIFGRAKGAYRKTRNSNMLPIHEFFGPAITSLLDDPAVEKVFQNKAVERLDVEVAKAMDKVLNGKK